MAATWYVPFRVTVLLLIGIYFANFKQLTKTEKIVNSAMLIAILVVFGQIIFV